MLNWIKLNIGRYFLHKNLRQNDKLSFNKFIANANSFFIITPKNDNEFTNAFCIIDYLVSLNKKITLLAENNKFNLIYYKQDDKNWFNLPKLSILQKVNEQIYDVAIDLDLEDNIFTPFITNKVKSKFRIGFKKNHSDMYYNFIVEPNKINSEISYKNLLNSLQLF